ncbi:Formylglycine-generating enzyme, required for sulfatase activity, contains SUMF1/FGE domain [Candidatus Electrothrix aarhusensis]|uniref:Formylglycine-generating enzyme, required for sulfatase activity, contains SUMF1/FGE domain n=1 Tax=Candidatus Electrothrix aarhusensis TaxID=1859131 RepID=A0A3S4T9C8_9BACT|nr:Formylglycine-generating enzyme, required for sulfatase activity, contains SUMF1/FGE domain [Candidatus Electrothrix aarhusensis]
MYPSRSLFLSAILLVSVTQAADYTNSIGMEFKSIAPGKFFMGSCLYSRADKERDNDLEQKGLPPQGPTCPAQVPEDKNALEEEAPQHKVKIRKGFQLGIHEVTLGQFKLFLAALNDQERSKIETEEFENINTHGDEAAVAAVSWEDAQTFIEWLNQKEGGEKYRLPTEAEWEYAARAGSKTIYFWGDTLEKAPKYSWFNMEHADLLIWFPEGEFNKKENFSHPVGLKKPNAWGLYDMAGNVWEWVNDKYSATYYQNSPNVDPTGPEAGALRCFRGGSWYGSATNLRSAFRGLNVPTHRSDSLGFRVVRETR